MLSQYELHEYLLRAEYKIFVGFVVNILGVMLHAKHNICVICDICGELFRGNILEGNYN